MENGTTLEVATLGGGCFWCLEAVFDELEGVDDVVSGYTGGSVPNPSYEAVCTGRTGHAEAVRVVYDPAVVGRGGEALLRVFWENHDSTQLNRHGNDVGTQYRSAVWTTTPEQAAVARATLTAFQRELARLEMAPSVTTIAPADSLYAEFGGPYYLAEEYHQGYLHKNPGGYCNHGPNGVTCPVGIANLPAQVAVLAPEDAPEDAPEA